MASPPADPSAIQAWQRRIFATVWITYFSFYLCRGNMSIAQVQIGDELKLTAEKIGMIASALLVMYAVGQFVNGILGDRLPARKLTTAGIFISAACNAAIGFSLVLASFLFGLGPDSAFFGMSPALIVIMVLWGINGFFQATGWPPNMRVVAHWFPRNRGRVTGWLGTSYLLGGAAADVLSGQIMILTRNDWRFVFWVPAAIFSLVGVFYAFMIRNRPEEAGLPSLDPPPPPGAGEGEARDGGEESIRSPFLNSRVWFVALAFFCLDLVRYGFLIWSPMILSAGGSVSLGEAGIKSGVIPLAGCFGAVFAGWASDRLFRGRRGPIVAFMMLALGGCTFLFARIPSDLKNLDFGTLAVQALKIPPEGGEGGRPTWLPEGDPAAIREALLARGYPREKISRLERYQFLKIALADDLVALDRLEDFAHRQDPAFSIEAVRLATLQAKKVIKDIEKHRDRVASALASAPLDGQPLESALAAEKILSAEGAARVKERAARIGRTNYALWALLCLAVVGFMTYGPHILMVGAIALDLGHKRRSSSTAGFIDAFGYLGAALSGWGTGKIVDLSHGRWEGATLFWAAAAATGSILMFCLWNLTPSAPRPPARRR